MESYHDRVGQTQHTPPGVSIAGPCVPRRLASPSTSPPRCTTFWTKSAPGARTMPPASRRRSANAAGAGCVCSRPPLRVRSLQAPPLRPAVEVMPLRLALRRLLGQVLLCVVRHIGDDDSRKPEERLLDLERRLVVQHVLRRRLCLLYTSPSPR